MHIGFWLGNLRERARLEDLGVDGKIILETVLQKLVEKAWAGSVCLKIGTGGGLL